MNARIVVLGVLVAVAGMVSTMLPATAVLNPNAKVAIVKAPTIALGDSPGPCQAAISNPSTNCLARLAGGDIAATVGWDPCHEAGCIAAVQKFTIYRVPASVIGANAVNPATAQNISSAGASSVSASRPVGPPAPASAPSGPTTQLSQQARMQIAPPSDHIEVGGGSWRGVGSWLGGQQTVALVANPQVGQCFVARVATAGGLESNDSNVVCIDATTRYGLETVTFSGELTQAHWSIPDLSPDCSGTYLASMSIDWTKFQVGRAPFSQTVGQASTPCTGTQVWETLTTFDVEPGTTKFPVWKAELVAGGDAHCVSEVDLIDGTWQSGMPPKKGSGPAVYLQRGVSPGPIVDVDATDMLNYIVVGGSYFHKLFRGFAFLDKNTAQCMGALSGFSLKVTRLR